MRDSVNMKKEKKTPAKNVFEWVCGVRVQCKINTFVDKPKQEKKETKNLHLFASW